MIGRLRRRVGAWRDRWLGTITAVDTASPIAALTFDDGPHPEFTPRVAELLERHDARATFFVRGEAAARSPALLRRLSDAGHALGNHSWSHPSFPSIGGRARRAEIRACARLLPGDAGTLFRFPFGHQTVRARLDAARLGCRVVGWSFSSGDWTGAGADEIAATVRARLRPGGVVLLHDDLFHPADPRCADREPTRRALAILLDELAGRYRFVTLPELLAAGRPVYERVFDHPGRRKGGGGSR